MTARNEKSMKKMKELEMLKNQSFTQVSSNSGCERVFQDSTNQMNIQRFTSFKSPEPMGGLNNSAKMCKSGDCYQP